MVDRPNNPSHIGLTLYHGETFHLFVFYVCAFGSKEGNVLFNDALNTFYLRLFTSDIW